MAGIHPQEDQDVVRTWKLIHRFSVMCYAWPNLFGSLVHPSAHLDPGSLAASM